MRFACTLKQLPDGRWSARYRGPAAEPFEVTSPSRDEALDKLRRELHYRIELCPCSGRPADYVELDVTQES